MKKVILNIVRVFLSIIASILFFMLIYSIQFILDWIALIGFGKVIMGLLTIGIFIFICTLFYRGIKDSLF